VVASTSATDFLSDSPSTVASHTRHQNYQQSSPSVGLIVNKSALIRILHHNMVVNQPLLLQHSIRVALQVLLQSVICNKGRRRHGDIVMPTSTSTTHPASCLMPTFRTCISKHKVCYQRLRALELVLTARMPSAVRVGVVDSVEYARV